MMELSILYNKDFTLILETTKLFRVWSYSYSWISLYTWGLIVGLLFVYIVLDGSWLGLQLFSPRQVKNID